MCTENISLMAPVVCEIHTHTQTHDQTHDLMAGGDNNSGSNERGSSQ